MAILIETRGPRNGQCNICGEEGKLTEDHTPPKGCIKITQVELHHITARLSLDTQKGKGRISQNGVKYKTLCSRCNNSILGARYDPDFTGFVNSIGKILKSGLYLPRVIPIKTKPQRVMRSLLGHLSAQGVNRYKKGPLTEPIRDYFLDETKPLPDAIKIYAWLYPYKHQIMARDCGYQDTRLSDHVLMWFLKFYPIAFMVTFNEPDSYNFPFNCFSLWGKKQIDFEVEMKIDLKDIPLEHWPEAPSKHSMIMYGQEAIVSFNRKEFNN